MRRLLAATLTLALSGCVTPPAGTHEPDANEGPPSFTLRECYIQEILFPVAPERLADHLPEGFVAEPFPAEGMSALIALGMRCAAPEATRMGMVIIPLASVPESVRRDGASAHGIITSMPIDEGGTARAHLEAWGYGPLLPNGTVRLEDAGPPASAAAARVGKATVASGDDGATFVIDTAVRGVPRTDEGNFLRFFMVHDRRVIGTWDADLVGDHRVHSGTASMDARGLPPLPEASSTGLGFHEFADEFKWTRVD